MNEHEFAELAAGHALHALSAEDETRYAAALRSHPEWQAIAETDAAVAGRLADAVTEVAPDVSVRDALLAQIASTPQRTSERVDEPAADDPRLAGSVPGVRASRPGPLRILFTLAASVVLLVGIGFGAVTLSNHLNRPASVVALAEIEASADAEQASVPLEGDGTATLHWSAELGAAVLVADGLEALDAEQSYELWFVRGETPLPAGVFVPESGATTVELVGEMHAGDVIAVTVEQSGGSPTGLPTTDPIFAIPTA